MCLLKLGVRASLFSLWGLLSRSRHRSGDEADRLGVLADAQQELLEDP